MAKRIFLLSCFLLISLVGISSSLSFQIIEYSVSGSGKYINTSDSIELSQITLDENSGLLRIKGFSDTGEVYEKSYLVIERISQSSDKSFSAKYKIKLISNEKINYLGNLIINTDRESGTSSFYITIMNDKEYYLTKLRR